MRDPRERLRDMVEAIAAIERYRDRDKDAFEKDELLQTWFLRHLQIIGEAMAPDIPWPKIIGMRNVLVHGYFEIDKDVVWDAAHRDVPSLKPGIQRLLHVLDRRKR